MINLFNLARTTKNIKDAYDRNRSPYQKALQEEKHYERMEKNNSYRQVNNFFQNTVQKAENITSAFSRATKPVNNVIESFVSFIPKKIDEWLFDDENIVYQNMRWNGYSDQKAKEVIYWRRKEMLGWQEYLTSNEQKLVKAMKNEGHNSDEVFGVLGLYRQEQEAKRQAEMQAKIDEKNKYLSDARQGFMPWIDNDFQFHNTFGWLDNAGKFLQLKRENDDGFFESTGKMIANIPGNLLRTGAGIGNLASTVVQEWVYDTAAGGINQVGKMGVEYVNNVWKVYDEAKNRKWIWQWIINATNKVLEDATNFVVDNPLDAMTIMKPKDAWTIYKWATKATIETWKIITKPVHPLFEWTKNIIKKYAGTPDEIAGIQAAIRPRVTRKWNIITRSQEQINNDIQLTNGLIRASGEKPVDLASYKTAVKNEMQKIGDEINRLTGQDLEVDLSASIGKLEELANSRTTQILDSGDGNKISALVENLKASKWKISVADAEDMNQWLNDTLKSPVSSASETTKRGYQILVADIRDALDNSISQIPGEFKEIKKAYGSLRNVYGDIIKREIVYNRQNPTGLIESIGAIEWAGEVVWGLGKMITWEFKQGATQIGKWIANNAVWRFITHKNDPNTIIKNIFAKDTPQQKNIVLPNIPLKSNLDNKKYQSGGKDPSLTGIYENSISKNKNKSNIYTKVDGTVVEYKNPAPGVKIPWKQDKRMLVEKEPTTAFIDDSILNFHKNANNTKKLQLWKELSSSQRGAVTTNNWSNAIIPQNPKIANNSIKSYTNRNLDASTISQAEAKAIVKKYFKDDIVSVRLAEKIITKDGGEAIGMYHKKMITFAKNPTKYTPEHEVMHAYFDLALDNKQKNTILKAIQKEQNLKTKLDAEEWLADTFAEFVAGRRETKTMSTKMKKIIDDLVYIFKKFFGQEDKVEALMRELEGIGKGKKEMVVKNNWYDAEKFLVKPFEVTDEFNPIVNPKTGMTLWESVENLRKFGWSEKDIRKNVGLIYEQHGRENPFKRKTKSSTTVKNTCDFADIICNDKNISYDYVKHSDIVKNIVYEEARKFKNAEDFYNLMSEKSRKILSDNDIIGMDAIETIYNRANKRIYYRWQSKWTNDIFYNDTGFVGNHDGWVYFTVNKDTAKKYGDVIERLGDTKNTVSVLESTKLQKLALKKLEQYEKQQKTPPKVIEEMALWRPRAFAEYTKKPYVETGDKFGEPWEMIYYKDIDEKYKNVLYVDDENVKFLRKNNVNKPKNHSHKTQFTHTTPIRNNLTKVEQKYFDAIKNIKIRKNSERIEVAEIPEFLWVDNDKIRPLYFSKNILHKIANGHGSFSGKNFIINANSWEYAVKYNDNGIDKIGLIKTIPNSNNIFIIHAERTNWYFTLTNYEPNTHFDVMKEFAKWQIYNRNGEIIKQKDLQFSQN